MTSKEKQCIGIVFGGNSNEHEISISSARTVFKALNSKTNKKRFTIKPFYISQFGTWHDIDISTGVINDDEIKNKLNNKEILDKEKINFLEKIEFKNVDVWFPLLHGLNGEDGAIHGLLRFTQKPIVGCGILGSALGMDKIFMKKIFSYLEIPQVNFLAIQDEDLNNEFVKQKIYREIIEKLNFPIFVKPSNSGSSLGISKVIEKSDIFQALEKAWKIDSRIIVEEGLEVRELECGVIGNSELATSEIGEVAYSSDWYNFESKYSQNNKIIIPAEVNSEITNQIKRIAIRSCRALNIYGFARVDFFLEKNSNKVFLNEINTIPGFTSQSMFPMLWEASGLNIEQLVAKIIEITIN